MKLNQIESEIWGCVKSILNRIKFEIVRNSLMLLVRVAPALPKSTTVNI